MYDSFSITLVINVLVFSAGFYDLAQASKNNDAQPVISNVTHKVNELGDELKNDSNSNTSSGNVTVKDAVGSHSHLYGNNTLHKIKRPNFRLDKACAQRSRVRSTCLDVGKRSKDDRLAFNKVVTLKAKKNKVQTHTLIYKLSHQWVKKGYVISYITVSNKMDSGTEALVTMLVGGSLDKFTYLVMETQQGRGMNFQVQVFMNVVESAYKSQISALSSYIQTLS